MYVEEKRSCISHSRYRNFFNITNINDILIHSLFCHCFLAEENHNTITVFARFPHSLPLHRILRHWRDKSLSFFMNLVDSKSTTTMSIKDLWRGRIGGFNSLLILLPCWWTGLVDRVIIRSSVVHSFCRVSWAKARSRASSLVVPRHEFIGVIR